MAGEFLSIPGNIKQLYLPFVLDPSNALNCKELDVVDSETGKEIQGVSTAGKTQFFSFKKSSIAENSANSSVGLIKIFPDSFSKVAAMHNDDLSYKSLFDYQTIDKNQRQVDFQDSVLNNIPTIQIREFLQDAKLDQMFQLFSAFQTGFNLGSNTGAAKDQNDQTSFIKKFYETTKEIFKNLPDILKTTFKEVMKDFPPKNFYDFDRGYKAYDDFILRIPYLLYYRLIGATTTNIYEIPYSGKYIDSSNGNEGWNTKRGLAGISTDGSSMLGTLVNYFGKNIRINTSPTWDGADSTNPIEIKIDFDLYNDSYIDSSDESAIMNFIFINTLVPGNKWLQYHVFQHAPNLYDIKIDGINRFFMCSGKFEVEGKGVIRRPSSNFINKLFGKYINKNFLSGEFLNNTDIRIPDIYECHLTFTSLLPNNFNNFLYSYYTNTKMETITGKDIHTNGILAIAANKLGEEIKKQFDTALNNINGKSFNNTLELN